MKLFTPDQAKQIAEDMNSEVPVTLAEYAVGAAHTHIHEHHLTPTQQADWAQDAVEVYGTDPDGFYELFWSYVRQLDPILIELAARDNR